MPFVQTDDVHIYYEHHGSNYLNQIPLVFAYGLGGNTSMWWPQVAALSQHHPLILWDIRGHGQTSLPQSGHYGLQVSADDLKCLLDHLDIKKAHVGGLSMGGGIAVTFALKYPERVRSLIVCDASTALPPELSPKHQQARGETLALARAGNMAALATRNSDLARGFCLRADEPEVAQKLTEMYVNMNPDAFVESLISLQTPSFTVSEVENISLPTLVITGSHDPVRPACERFHQGVAGSVYKVLRSAGHLSNIDQAAAFNQALLTFLDAQP
ncbi:MAG: alpha/beta fold hydrolase [Deinococcota bacterium]